MTIPADVRTALLPDEQTHWMNVYQLVLDQTGDDEKATLAAWGAIRRQRKLTGRSEDMLTVPSLRMEMVAGLPIVKGWGMLFTDPTHRDSYDTFFNEMTALMTEYYANAPLWYEHGLDTQYQFHPIGKRHRIEIFPFGIWVEHVLWIDHPHFARTRHEIETGQLAYSSDSIAHYYAIWLNRASGHVRAWPLAGWSLVKKPSEYALGPVTLDGMTAMIQEVANTPAQRTTIDEGRATLTLTACKSVIFPPTDPTVAAVNLSAAIRQAREARGLEAGTSFRSLSSPMEVNTMDPELLQNLAEFFGVEATLDAIRGALRSLAAGEIEVDVTALRSVLELDESAPDSDIVEELTAMVDLLEVEAEPEPMGTGGSLRALRTARTRALVIADHTPAPSPVPTQVPTQALRSQRGRRQFHAPNVNHNEANPPSFIDAVMAGLGRRGPNMRADASLQAIRADLFQLDQAARADSGHGPSGAFVLNREISATILEPLREQLVLEQAGATYIPMAGLDSLTIRKMVGVPGAYWAAENTEVSGDDTTWAVAQLVLKELRAPTTWPNRWFRNLAAGAEQQILNQIVKSMRLKMESSALFGTGGVPADGTSTGAEPLGIYNTPGITLVTLSPEASPTIEHLETAVAGLEDNNVEETDTWRWISAPRTFRSFTYKKDQNGQPILRNSWADGPEQTLVDYRYHKTTAVPITDGAGSASTLFFGDWAELLFGMGMDVELLVSTERYIEMNQTFVMGVAYVDTVVGYPEAFSVTEGLLK